jgi:hypothetical protein
VKPLSDPWAVPEFPQPLADGLHAHPRPTQPLLDADRVRVEESCPECYGQDVRQYRVLSEGGWWLVTKCQKCLASLSRVPAPLFGVYKPLGYVPAMTFGKGGN